MQNADSWHQRIISASKETMISPEYQTIRSRSVIVKSPTIRKMSESVHIVDVGGTNSQLPDRPHTISASKMNATSRRAQISAHTFVPPKDIYDAAHDNRFNEHIPASLKPPLPKRQQQIVNSGKNLFPLFYFYFFIEIQDL